MIFGLPHSNKMGCQSVAPLVLCCQEISCQCPIYPIRCDGTSTSTLKPGTVLSVIPPGFKQLLEPYMASSIHKQRHRAAVNQAYRCYYCGMPMWEANPTQFSDRYQISKQQVDHFQCTGEHLLAKCDGGPNSASNIVAACKYCNQARHNDKDPLTAAKYKKKVKSLAKMGQWHTSRILQQAQQSKSPKAK